MAAIMEIQYDRRLATCERTGQEMLDSIQSSPTQKNQFRFAGYFGPAVRHEVFKTGQASVRAYDRIMNQIPESVNRDMEFFVRPRLRLQDLELAHIHFSIACPLATGSPVADPRFAAINKLIGSQFKQVEGLFHAHEHVLRQLLHNIELQ